MNLTFILLLVGAYLLGSVPTAYLAARLTRGIDVRQYGTGNVGASNLLKLTSKWLTAPVFLFDIAKGMLPVWLGQRLGLSLSQQIVVGLMAIIGHNWTVYLRFNGGRGIATTLGVTLFLMSRLTLILLVIVLICTPIHYMPLATILVLAIFSVAGWFSHVPWVSWLTGWSAGTSELLPVTLGLLAIPFIAAIRRVSVPRSRLSYGIGRGELFFNRLFLDRDIRDREAWVNRKPDEEEKG